MDSLQEIQDNLVYDDEELPKVRYEKKLHFDLNKTHSYIDLVIADSEPFFMWDNSTYFGDRDALFSLAKATLNKKGESKMKGILDWCKDKRVHIKVALSLFRKELKK